MTEAKKYGNENNTVSVTLEGYHDGEGGYDILTINAREAQNPLFFSAELERGRSYIYFDRSGDYSLSLDIGSTKFVFDEAPIRGHYSQYHESLEKFVAFKNFEEVNLIGSKFNDFIGYQNGSEYHGGQGVDTFFADWSTWEQKIHWVNDGSAITFNHTKPINISGMESLFLYLSKGDDVVDNSAFSVPTELSGNEGNDLLITGGGNDVLYGGKGKDILKSGAGDDELFPGEDNDEDIMYGGAGNDIYWVWTATDQVVENPNEGIDKVRSFVKDFDLRNYPNVESLSYWGEERATLHGNESNNFIRGASAFDTLYGYGGDDILNGSWGPDYMIGGQGNDTYIVDSKYDYITEKKDEGEDTVESTLDDISLEKYYNVENLVYKDTEDAVLRGNTLNNKISGNKGNDSLYGLDGNDMLDGGEGADTMYGGAGNDSYYVDNAGDKVIEEANEGRDTVFSTIDYDLSKADNIHIENAVLQGTGNLTLQGNNEANLLKGNAGNNHLKGLAGNDWLEGGAGDDILNGNAGADRMIGGTGNDVYYVDNRGDVVVEEANGGRDTVNVFFDYDLMKVANIENAILIGTANAGLQGNNGANLLKGNAGNNHLKGLAGNDWLEGGAGDDILNGNAGADRMIGGTGNDVYYVDNRGDVVVEEANGGRDTVNVFFDYDLMKVAHIENAALIGTANAGLQGNNGANLLKGNAGNNQLKGLGGNDWLDGGAGNDVLIGGSGKDTLVGGAGKDTFKFVDMADSTLSLRDVITDFKHGEDKIDLSALDANTKSAGNQAFSFIGAAGFSAAGQVRFAGGVVYGDVNGDKVADFAIELKNVTTLQASDFIL